MLNLQRKLGETVIIDGEITVTVLEFKENSSGEMSVKLGIGAPKEIIVDRQEVHFRKMGEEKRGSSQTPHNN